MMIMLCTLKGLKMMLCLLGSDDDEIWVSHSRTFLSAFSPGFGLFAVRNGGALMYTIGSWQLGHQTLTFLTRSDRAIKAVEARHSDLDNGTSRRACRWIKSQEGPPIVVSVKVRNKISANPCDVHSRFESEWGTIYNQWPLSDTCTDEEWDTFLEAHRDDISVIPLSLPTLDGQAYSSAAAEADDSACSLDGWRISELKLLPPIMWELLADIHTLCEKVGRWPDAYQYAYNAMIPKEENAQHPLDNRPITVISQLYCIYLAVRWKHVEDWHTNSMYPMCRGAIRQGETDDITWHTYERIESRRRCKLSSYGWFQDSVEIL